MLLESDSNKGMMRALTMLSALVAVCVLAVSDFATILVTWALLALIWLTYAAIISLRTKRGPSNQQHPNQENLTLALNLQGAGRLDSAFTILKNSLDQPRVIPMLYNLARDYEIVRNSQKAAEIYGLIAARQPDYRDVPRRILEASHQRPVEPEKGMQTNRQQGTRPLFNHRYAISKQLGAGANSKVYLAHDQKQHNKLVALKVMNLEPETNNRHQHAELLSRFLKESSTATQLDHPNIIRVLDSCKLDHVAYMCMEYVPGVSLKLHSSENRLLPESIIVNLMIQCAEALAYAHSKGVIHRDVKPANIIYDAALDQAKLTDFGIARLANSTATVAGSFLGTPSYMSPEQIGGYHLDQRSDIYSLGATMFRLLTGRTPYEASTMGELMQAIASQNHHDILQLSPDLHPCVKPVIDKALAKDPASRYQQITEMAKDLRACQLAIEKDIDRKP